MDKFIKDVTTYNKFPNNYKQIFVDHIKDNYEEYENIFDSFDELNEKMLLLLEKCINDKIKINWSKTEIINDLEILNIDKVILDYILNILMRNNNSISPYPYQQKVINKATIYFNKYDRGKLNIFCRLGKTLISFWIAQKLNYNKILILVPSLDLLFQTYHELKRVSENNYNYLLVGSQKQKKILDTITTDEKDIKYFLKSNRRKKFIIISTYQSSPILHNIRYTIDMCIFDEAHKTCGIIKKNITGFKCLLQDGNLKINKRLFMTATEKIYTYDKINNNNYNYKIYSMNDKKIYGETIKSINCIKALKLGAINNYKIITINENITDSTNKDDILLAKAESLLKVIINKDIKHTISFHSRINYSTRFKTILENLIEKYNYNINVYTINGRMNMNRRKKILKEFQSNGNKTIITSAKVLQEGINLPECDGVAFIDNKSSEVDCIQSICRCLTKTINKKLSYIIIPIITRLENLLKNKDYVILRMILRNLAEYDDTIKTYFIDIMTKEKNKKVKNKIIEFFGNDDCDNFEEFFKNIASKIWDDLDKFSLMGFELARKYVHTKNITCINDWKKNYKNGDIRNDVPYNPDDIYKNMGWRGWFDWLGIDISKYPKSKNAWIKVCKRNNVTFNNYNRKAKRIEELPPKNILNDLYVNFSNVRYELRNNDNNTRRGRM